MLSMFSNFGFDWPPAIKALFNIFSLVNFNFELLAPECSVSLNFEAKWCVDRPIGSSELCCSRHCALDSRSVLSRISGRLCEHFRRDQGMLVLVFVSVCL